MGWEDPQRRKWQPTPVPLPGKSHGRRNLVGCSPWGCKSWTRLSNFTFFLTPELKPTFSSLPQLVGSPDPHTVLHFSVSLQVGNQGRPSEHGHPADRHTHSGAVLLALASPRPLDFCLIFVPFTSGNKLPLLVQLFFRPLKPVPGRVGFIILKKNQI